jgi:HD-like signal output (HDOD) protein/CheY-like chemotaxis protein
VKFLIVDDELVSRTKLGAILGAIGECRAVDSGKAAISAVREALEAGAPFDLITLDIAMPGMDGTEVLFEIRNLEDSIKLGRPTRAKILMITAQTDRDSLITCVQAGCDDYVVKPFDPTIIMQRLQKLGLLVRPPASVQTDTPAQPAAPGKPTDKVALGQEVMRRFQRGEISLPSPAGIYRKFQKLIEEGAGLMEIADLLKEDVGMSFHLISVSNSPFYRGVSENKNLHQAVGRLGLDQTRKYVDVLCNRAVFTTTNKAYQPFMEKLWEHSMACAHASETITAKARIHLENDPFTLGLLHDVGKMVLIQLVSELETSGTLGGNVDRTELLNTLAAYHGSFGEVVLKQWKFHEEYALVAKYHDAPENAETMTKALAAVHLANLTAKAMGYGRDQTLEVDLAQTVSAKWLKLDAQAIEEVKSQVALLLEETKTVIT